MPKFTVSIPAGWNAELDDAGDLQDYLKANGVIVNSVLVNNDGTAVVDANTDPAPFLPSYTSTKAGKQAKINEAITSAKPLIRAIFQKPDAQRTNQEKIVAGLAAAIWRDEVAE